MRITSQVGSSRVRQSMTASEMPSGTSGSQTSRAHCQPRAMPISPPVTPAASTDFHNRPGRSAMAWYSSLGGSSASDPPSNLGSAGPAPPAPAGSPPPSSAGSSGSGSGTRSMMRGTSTPAAADTSAPNAAASRFAAQSIAPDPTDLAELREVFRRVARDVPPELREMSARVARDARRVARTAQASANLRARLSSTSRRPRFVFHRSAASQVGVESRRGMPVRMTIEFPEHPFTLPMARELGIPRKRVAAAVRQRVLQRLFHGVYLRADVELTMEVKAAAAALVVSPHAVLCDRTAAWIWGVDCFRYRELDVVPDLEVFTLPRPSSAAASSRFAAASATCHRRTGRSSTGFASRHHSARHSTSAAGSTDATRSPPSTP